MEKIISSHFLPRESKAPHLICGLVLGVISGLAAASHLRAQSPLLFACTAAALLYAAIILLPRSAALVSILAYCAAALIQTAGLPGQDALRLLLFGAVLLVIEPHWSRTPPLNALALLWLIYLLCAWTSFFAVGEAAADWFLPLQQTQALAAVGELIFVAVIGLMLLRERFNSAVRALRGRLSILLVIEHMLALPALLLTFGLILALRTVPEIEYEIFGDGFQFSPAIPAALAGSLLVISVLSRICARGIHSFFSILNSAATLGGATAPAGSHLLAVPLFREALNSVSTLALDLQQARKQLRETKFELDERQKKLHEQAGELQALQLAVQSVPGACLILRMDGKIVAANDQLFELLQLDPEKTDLKDYTTLFAAANVWAKDLEDVISWACWKLRTLLDEGPQVRYLRSLDGWFVELLIHAEKKPGSRSTSADPRALPPPEDVIFFMYLRKCPDIRTFQLRLLGPSAFSLLGLRTAKICETALRHIDGALDAVALAAARLTYFRQHDSDHPAVKAICGELSSLLGKAEETARAAAQPLAQLAQQVSPPPGAAEPFNLSIDVPLAVDLLYNLLAIEYRPSVITESDREKLDDKPLEHSPASSAEDVRIDAAPQQSTIFLAALLCVVKNIAPRAHDLAITLDYEIIGSGTADIITGSMPGRYARLTLQHSGQSVAAYMLSGQITDLDLRRSPLDDLEAALTFFRHQIQQLGGFLSIQSSATKGTTITVYLPQSADALSRVPRKIQQEYELMDVAEGEGFERRALLISNDEVCLQDMTITLHRLGYFVKARRRDQFFSLKISGIAASSDDAEFVDDAQQPQADMEGEGYSLTVVDGGSCQDEDLRPMLQEITRHSPHSVKLLLVDEGSLAPSPTGWIVIAKPLNESALAFAMAALGRF